ncbi:hypothetical protein DFJ73DRAFT_797438 [Zopfochytrium polystomum]|nr:hypothetical protein DFJ73DRAFT_797438 [Zopfochytrium polystomum]
MPEAFIFKLPPTLPSPADFCKDQIAASNKCMSKFNYDRRKYMTACSKTFQDYNACKERWKELKRRKIQEYEKSGL